MYPDRRHVLVASLAGAGFASTGGAGVLAAATRPFGDTALAAAVRAWEARSDGRLGLAVIDTGSGRRFAWRGGERFPMASTFKLILAAAVLRRVDRGAERLDRPVRIAAADLVPYAPVVQPRVGQTLTVGDLAEAIIVWSDNAAANLLLATVGGPAGLTAFARSIGDPVFRLDRTEPALNEATPGDPRDTTTPGAMAESLQRLLRGPALSPASRERLTGWMIACRTGTEKLRAGLPPGWRWGDKTGNGGHGSTNDIGIAWPPGRPPILIAAYITGTVAPVEAKNAAFAGLARAIAAAA